MKIQPPIDLNDETIVSVFDELPLWSAPFGLALLDTVNLRSGLRVLDVGCGTGFPLIELGQRLGDPSRLYGLDPWEKALQRTLQKIKAADLTNTGVVRGSAGEMPFADGFFDLIVSNNGLNNVPDPGQALAECFRVAKPKAQMVLTVNLPGTMKEFYTIYRRVLTELGMTTERKMIRDHIHAKRKPLAETLRMVRKAGFRVVRSVRRSFNMRFLNGTALFDHFFIRLGFLEPWKKIIPPSDREQVFAVLEIRLNEFSRSRKELKLSIPFVCIDCRKPGKA